ncbi:MAG: undecaprenyl-diphosphate phosphatase [Spirochaetales bacterium]|nr:undecaprenyl-diphosphate phosphatase [Spirochaetales bacterium]MBR6200433.1 undecaprenyl-diphosphate phosphatase [Spirochaetales bacterium]
MEILKATLIAVIQGITEFLPISSSGHIILMKQLLGFEIDSNLFDIVVHFGTLISVVIFFRVEIAELICGVFRRQTDSKLFNKTFSQSDILKIWLYMIIAIIPAGIVGLLLDDFLDTKFTELGNVRFIILGCLFAVTAVILLSTKFIKSSKNTNLYEISWVQALLVGVAQAFAVLPGISRSGTTITAGIAVGMNKEDAGRFSFLLSIPVIAAAFMLKILKLALNGVSEAVNIPLLITALAVSALVGFFALKFLFKILSSKRFWVFSIYMIVPIVVSFVLYFVV